jgi:DNA repair protein RecO (recombination protein O)
MDMPFFEMTEGFLLPLLVLWVSMKLICLKTNYFALWYRSKDFSRYRKTTVIKILINYYRHHLDGFKEPKSLDVLKEVFSYLFRLSLRIIENHCSFYFSDFNCTAIQ